MTTVRPYKKQSTFDVALMLFGNIEQAFMLAIENNLSITDSIETLELNTKIIPDKPAIVNYYKNNNLIPATALSPNEQQGGIGMMAVEIDFIVS